MERTADESLRDLLELLTRNRLMEVLIGVTVTATIQNNSAIIVTVVGLVNDGIFDLSQSVTMGANIGTTMTAQLIAFKEEIKLNYTLDKFLGFSTQ